MPRSAGTPCRASGCTALSRPGSGYCDAHRAVARGGRKRKSSGPYNRARWRKLRKMQLRRQPLCEDCLEAGRVTEAKDVHHIIPRKDGGPDAFDNFMSLCKSHHSKRTRAEAKGDDAARGGREG